MISEKQRRRQDLVRGSRNEVHRPRCGRHRGVGNWSNWSFAPSSRLHGRSVGNSPAGQG